MDGMKHLPFHLSASPSRVVIRPFHLAVEPRSLNAVQTSRAHRIVAAVLALSEEACLTQMSLVNTDFHTRHWQTRKVFLRRCAEMMESLDLGRIHQDLSEPRRELIGAYFCHEYSYAAAALMNPSVVPHVDQSGLPDNAIRIIISLRAVGEGHISSIVFREGIFYSDGSLVLQPEPPFAVATASVGGARDGEVIAERDRDVSLSGTVIFPFTAAQRNGLEDLRLVRFEEGGGRYVYYGTYTAYSGSAIASEIMETRDFRTFSLRSLTGDAAKNKGLALFPRKINGAYAMIGRHDNESLFLLRSHDLHHWEPGAYLLGPKYPWDLVQMGNCGAPMEIDEGWLVLTHGVGPMRQYSVGAALLDKMDPSKVIGRSELPLLTPLNETREGYVPNVVYTCGGLVFQRTLFLPYGVADSSVRFCCIDIDSLLRTLKPA
ncbi:MAG: glycoside hydrolase family 130 protein [Alphaproteobacteria bacterium]|nr:glycoside hydrolase family 130 protein [Alphaproteobacteria bacterium]